MPTILLPFKLSFGEVCCIHTYVCNLEGRPQRDDHGGLRHCVGGYSATPKWEYLSGDLIAVCRALLGVAAMLFSVAWLRTMPGSLSATAVRTEVVASSLLSHTLAPGQPDSCRGRRRV